MKKSYIFISFLIFLIILAIVISPKIYIEAFSNGMLVWATILLPTIFPLIFFTKILTDLGVVNTIANKFTITQKLFKTPPISAYAFMISIMSGYPVGAKVVSDLYERRLITKNEAFKISTFTSNSGPMFIYGSVGIGMFFSRTIGLILLASHIIGAVLNGILYRNYNKKDFVTSYNKIPPTQKFSLGDSMADSVVSILIIGGFVCVFFVVIEIVNNLGIFSILASFFAAIFNTDASIFLGVFNGLLEITHGCMDITSLNTLKTYSSALICCGIITFGGIATMLQAFAFLQKIEMKLGFFLLQKTTHTLFSLAVCALLLFIFL